MSNNTTINAGSGGDVIRDIDRSGVKTQVVQVDVGGTAGESLLTATAKGTQGSVGLPVQALRDAGRNTVCYYSVPTITTATDALNSLVGYKSGAAVGTTPTPAVVTSGKTLHITNITITYVGVATAGNARITLRANTSGTVLIGSPAVCTWNTGAPAAAAGVTTTLSAALAEGLEFAAGTGIGISVQGFTSAQAAGITGYVQVALVGFEY